MANTLNRAEMRDWPLNLLDAVAGDGCHWSEPVPPDVKPTIAYVLAQIGEDEAKLIYRRYRDLDTMWQIGSELGVSTETIRRREADVLRQLRHPARKAWLTVGVAGGILSAKEQAIGEETAKAVAAISEIAEAIRAAGGLGQLAEAIEAVNAKRNVADTIQAALRESSRSILDEPIDVLDLSTRAWGCLTHAGIDTCGKLVGLSQAQLRNIRNLGAGTAMEIQDAMARHGLYLHGRGTAHGRGGAE